MSQLSQPGIYSLAFVHWRMPVYFPSLYDRRLSQAEREAWVLPRLTLSSWTLREFSRD